MITAVWMTCKSTRRLFFFGMFPLPCYSNVPTYQGFPIIAVINIL